MRGLSTVQELLSTDGRPRYLKPRGIAAQLEELNLVLVDKHITKFRRPKLSMTKRFPGSTIQVSAGASRRNYGDHGGAFRQHWLHAPLQDVIIESLLNAMSILKASRDGAKGLCDVEDGDALPQ